ncbi:hypothetical protein CMI37_31175 [Candidatus Pacearchaeota archaeon]|nr:hypothetical protein [Candidatus Pacearchaeota archaeon]|tara:strand:+ start:2224 stop:2886 length:663 start_codon:yes stop_codon:yes gene_type:complete
MISDTCDDRMARKLFTVYGDRFPAEMADELIDGLKFANKSTTDEEYEEAITEWCATSKWPPKPVDVVNLIQRNKSKSIVRSQEIFDREQDAVETPPDEETTRTVEVFGRQLTYRVEHRTHICRDCSDTGKAHFYSIGTTAFLVSEWEDMTQEERDTCAHHTAICDCASGSMHPHRAWRTVIWHRGKERDVSVYALMEAVRKRCRSFDNPSPISDGRRFEY